MFYGISLIPFNVEKVKKKLKNSFGKIFLKFYVGTIFTMEYLHFLKTILIQITRTYNRASVNSLKLVKFLTRLDEMHY